MGEYTYLFDLAIILFLTKAFGILSRKFHMPQVVGMLIAGIILGPSILNLVVLDGDTGVMLNGLSEIGVILLMFSAGLETDVSELKENSVSAFVVATIGVIVPIICGYLTYVFVLQPEVLDTHEMMKAVFIGVVLSATSVSITVETLKEMGKLNGKVGTTILGAAVIDDILGIIVLTVITGMEDQAVSLQAVLGRIGLYFLVIAVVFVAVNKGKSFIEKYDGRRCGAIMALVFCFLLAFASEEFFGIADITGAYFAGLILCNLKLKKYVDRKIEIVSYMIFSPLFFASVGLKTSLSGMSSQLVIFSIVLLASAIISKMIGCGIGAKTCGFSMKESIQIGTGMVSRGEVALIVAQKGYQYGLLANALFAPIVLTVIVTTLLTPILLKVVMSEEAEAANLKFRIRKKYA